MECYLGAAQMFQLVDLIEIEEETVKNTYHLADRCRTILNQEWNSELPHSYVLVGNLRRIAGDSDDENRNERKKSRTEESKTTPEQKGKFIPVTPRPRKDANIPCQDVTCDSRFSTHGAHRSHFTKKHVGQNYINPPKVFDPSTKKMGVEKTVVDKVTTFLGLPCQLITVNLQIHCRACHPNTMHVRNKIKTHLATVHHVEEARDRKKNVSYF